MITKRELLNITLGLVDEIEQLQIKVAKLEKDFGKIKTVSGEKNIDGVKKKPGRPRKSTKA